MVQKSYELCVTGTAILSRYINFPIYLATSWHRSHSEAIQTRASVNIKPCLLTLFHFTLLNLNGLLSSSACEASLGRFPLHAMQRRPGLDISQRTGISPLTLDSFHYIVLGR